MIKSLPSINILSYVGMLGSLATEVPCYSEASEPSASTYAPAVQEVSRAEELPMSFDAFLECGCPPNLSQDAWKLHEAKELSVLNIQDWRGILGDTKKDILDRLVVKRRTNLWRMLLASYGRNDTSPFTVPTDPKLHMTLRRTNNGTRAWAPDPQIPYSYGSSQLSLLMDPFPDDVRFYSPFAIPIAPRSRASHYVLRPQLRLSYDLPLQQIHVSPYSIPPELADVPCRTFTPEALLAAVNDIFGTFVPLERVADHMSSWISGTQDLGTMYAMLRAWWPPPLTEIQGSCLRVSRNPPFNAFGGFRPGKLEWFNGPWVPRRVWDLYSNRVISFNDLYPVRQHDRIPKNVWAVSHSWVAEADLQRVWTPINEHQWPVPIPKATTLDHIRIELLNMGAEYVFLDVLCLRQQGAEDMEAIRREEWETDIPGLQNVYRHDDYQTTIIYFNGLGMPLDIRRELLDSPFHWFSRSWTLQETVTNWLPGGLSVSFARDVSGCLYFSNRMRDSLRIATNKRPSFDELFNAFSLRQGYAYKKPFDQVLALLYLYPGHTKTCYSEEYTSADDAWDDAVVKLSASELLELLVCFPFPRRLDPSPESQRWRLSRWSSRSWWPTWKQLVSCPERAPPPTVECSDRGRLERCQITVTVQEVSSELAASHTRGAVDDDVLTDFSVGATGLNEGAAGSHASSDDFERSIVHPEDMYDLHLYGNEWHFHTAYVVEGCYISKDPPRLTIKRQQTPNTSESAVTHTFDFTVFLGPERFDLEHPANGFTLVGMAELECWVVCVPVVNKEMIFEVCKVAVGRMYNERHREQLRSLDLGQTREVYYRCRLVD